ncbi:hypothetical protein ZWY2020_048381 [Hordeum vulgare]|nr:hypothetical protein ZWY2020_048381 [Hordeum vulgare]
MRPAFLPGCLFRIRSDIHGQRERGKDPVHNSMFARGPTRRRRCAWCQMAPAGAGAGFSGVALNETRRRRPRGICVLSSCYYTINCNIPNRPFGFCCHEVPGRNSSKLL